jgi:hypothetical protein
MSRGRAGLFGRDARTDGSPALSGRARATFSARYISLGACRRNAAPRSPARAVVHERPALADGLRFKYRALADGAEHPPLRVTGILWHGPYSASRTSQNAVPHASHQCFDLIVVSVARTRPMGATRWLWHAGHRRSRVSGSTGSGGGMAGHDSTRPSAADIGYPTQTSTAPRWGRACCRLPGMSPPRSDGPTRPAMDGGAWRESARQP